MTQTPVEDRLLKAIIPHVPFDGWSEAAYRAAIAESEVSDTVARALYPRGAVDLALAYHRRGDSAMIARINETDLSAMRFRDRIAFAVRARLEAVDDKELVRRGMTLFSLPNHAPDGARAVWGTVDAIWTALGDSSDDVNWYTKRATLSAVYSATVLYWLGDQSADNHATWEFLDRRIDNVMQIEKLKAQARDNPVLSKLMAGPNMVLSRLRAPKPPSGFPGRWRPEDTDN
ncbi:COQ9 family protein [Marinovum sp.]|uniref:COQ9 family protein n=1 Tax=Marinovum sp. TaxID=2024839 RepID=UPI002B2715D5|nr:COQ9 family protein [Marinovum sp.]